MKNVFELKSPGGQYKIYLPDHNIDHIQKIIAATNEPYEKEMLLDIASKLNPGDLYLDIGANIGNHSLFVASLKCKVFSFEPNIKLVQILRQSIAYNGFENLIKISNFGLGKKESRANFAAEVKENTGMQTLIEDTDGGIEIKTLDSLTFPQKIKIIKIDVEQMEVDVLYGAQKTIAENRPIMYIESQGQEFQLAMEFLARLDYIYWDTFNATPTHLFIPLELIETWWQPGHPSNNMAFLLHRTETRFKSSLLLLLEARKTMAESKKEPC
jgi:FkbM family methyltransferase